MGRTIAGIKKKVLFVCLHPDNKVALNYETAYDLVVDNTYLAYIIHDTTNHILIFFIPVAVTYICQVYKAGT